uniref:Protein MMS22-like N-terminal domain-containing protein n=1 Tax=Branchiostoma floridae TaxID=7739 RepID=C3Z695_BRAFL|eukprot:XP_002595918.1 hypothetical protein BRAFLDRAFT_98552 [Branchiostoma floridae]
MEMPLGIGDNNDLFQVPGLTLQGLASVSEFSQKGLDPSLRHQLWALLSIYVESSQDLCENSTLLHLSQAKLLASGYSQLLPVCRETELRTVFNFIQTLLAKHRSLYKRALRQQEEGVQQIQSTNMAVLQQQYRDIADALWTHIFPYVKKHSMTLTPPPTLADVAAGFTFLALDLQQQTFSSIFQYFGPEDSVCARQQQTFSSIFQYFGPEDSVCARVTETFSFILELLRRTQTSGQIAR